MVSSAIIYKSPRLYSIAIKFLHFGGFKKVKEVIGKRKKVFEPACGFGRLYKYLDPSCSYAGIDLNEKFINFGKKNGLDIHTGDIFDEKNYVRNDIIILCDILHHLTISDIKKLVLISTKFAKEKIVIMEPAFVGIAAGKGLFSRLSAKIFAQVDFDGINHIDIWFTMQNYHNLFNYLKSANNFTDMKIQLFNRYCLVELVF